MNLLGASPPISFFLVNIIGDFYLFIYFYIEFATLRNTNSFKPAFINFFTIFTHYYIYYLNYF